MFVRPRDCQTTTFPSPGFPRHFRKVGRRLVFEGLATNRTGGVDGAPLGPVELAWSTGSAWSGYAGTLTLAADSGVLDAPSGSCPPASSGGDCRIILAIRCVYYDSGTPCGGEWSMDGLTMYWMGPTLGNAPVEPGAGLGYAADGTPRLTPKYDWSANPAMCRPARKSRDYSYPGAVTLTSGGCPIVLSLDDAEPFPLPVAVGGLSFLKGRFRT